jgi:molybdenum cofactor cytidylyltransferase
LLAGGSSKRMGRSKQLLPLGTEPLLAVALKHAVASRLDPVILVLGHGAEEIRNTIEPLLVHPKIIVVTNPRYKEGMSESIKEGLKAVAPFPVSGVLILLADQPCVDARVINRMIEAFLCSGKPICQPVYGGMKGNPVLFHRALFPFLFTITGDQGGRELLRGHPEWVHHVFFPDPETGIDLDTPEAYQRFKERWEEKR